MKWTGTGLLVVISAPSGGGKSTVIRMLRRHHPEFLYSVSVTTRPRRKGERQGEHYRFLSEPAFEQMRAEGELAEWAEVHGHLYGTPATNIRLAVDRLRVILFDLDVQGSAALRQSQPQVVSIFLLPPSMAVLKRRLAKRCSDSAVEQSRRLQNALAELARQDEYDYWVTNDRLQPCVGDCEAIIRAELLRRERLTKKDV